MPVEMTVQLGPALCVFLPVHWHSLHHTVSEVVREADQTENECVFLKRGQIESNSSILTRW